MKSLRLPLLLCSALGFWAPCAFSETSTVPTLLSYQGLLSDSAGNLIGAAAPVNRTVQFRLYNVSTGGTPIWAESQVVTISAGEFSVLIGNGSGIAGLTGPSAPAAQPFKSLADAVNASASAAIFVGLTVDDANAATTDVEVSPRQQLVSGMFALRARVAETVATGAITSGMIADSQVSTNALQTSAVTTVKLADAAITSAKIADGAVLAVDLASAAVTASKIDTNSVGLWSVNGANIHRPAGNVGIGTTAPGYPLSFPPQLGDKVSLWGGESGNHLGFGIQPNALQIFGANVNDDVVMGYGSSYALTEVMRVKGNGSVGIGTSTPAYPLSFPNTLGDKITLWGQSGNHYGFGIQGGLLQIFTDSTGSDVAFGNGTSYSMNETMRIKGNGRLGIGTNNPQGGLHVYEPSGTSGGPTAGSLTLEHGDNYGASSIIFPSRANYGSDFGYIQYLDHRNYRQAGESARLIIGTSNDGDDHICLIPAGYVGIRTYDPIAPLHVAASATFNLGGYGYLAGGGRQGGYGSTNADYSIYANGRIACPEFNAFSDRRLKKEITPISGTDAMRFVRAVPAVSFRWKTGSETGLKYGYIAQDVAKMGMENLVGLIPDPELEEEVDENLFVSPKGARLSLNYTSFIPLLSAAVGDLDDRAETAAAELKAALAKKDAQIGALEARIAALEKLMGASK